MTHIHGCVGGNLGFRHWPRGGLKTHMDVVMTGRNRAVNHTHFGHEERQEGELSH